MKSITVLVVTYNQEEEICRCLDSILAQMQFGLKHIVICDDCSKDGTWKKLQEYKMAFPNVVMPYRNERNLGIYENTYQTLSYRGEADLYHQIAGDDVLCDGWFKSIQEYIDCHDIDFNEPIGFYSDWKRIDALGNEEFFSQSLVNKGLNLFSLYIRGLICNRSLLVNDKVLELYSPIDTNRSLNVVESEYDAQDHRLIKKVHYVPYIGSIYYQGIGVSSSLDIEGSDYLTTQNIEKWKFFLAKYINDEADRYYAYANIEMSSFFETLNMKSFFKAILFFHKGRMKGISYSLGEYVRFARPMLGFLKQRLI